MLSFFRLKTFLIWGRRLFLASLVCCAVVEFPVGAFAQPIAVDLVDEGDEAYSRFDNAGALNSYERALVFSPDSFDILARLARTYIDRALELADDGDDARAKALFEKALAVSEELLLLHADRAESHFLKARALGRLAQYAGGRRKVHIGRQVEALCSTAIAIDPDFAPAYVGLAIYAREVAGLNWIQRFVAKRFYGGLKGFSTKETIAFLEKTIELEPEINVSYWELANHYRNEGDIARTEQYLRKLLSVAPFNTADLRYRSEALAMLQELQK